MLYIKFNFQLNKKQEISILKGLVSCFPDSNEKNLEIDDAITLINDIIRLPITLEELGDKFKGIVTLYMAENKVSVNDFELWLERCIIKIFLDRLRKKSFKGIIVSVLL